jgi:hypothetical protein
MGYWKHEYHESWMVSRKGFGNRREITYLEEYELRNIIVVLVPQSTFKLGTSKKAGLCCCTSNSLVNFTKDQNKQKKYEIHVSY